LATRPLLPQHDGAARIVAHDVERVLADIDADYGDRSIELLRHRVLLVFGAPCQLRWLAGQEHGRTIPLAEFAARIGVPIETVRNWEQGKRSPRGPARALLKMIDQAPQVAFAVLSSAKSER
jgi:hypothetical protein